MQKSFDLYPRVVKKLTTFIDTPLVIGFENSKKVTKVHEFAREPKENQYFRRENCDLGTTEQKLSFSSLKNYFEEITLKTQQNEIKQSNNSPNQKAGFQKRYYFISFNFQMSDGCTLLVQNSKGTKEGHVKTEAEVGVTQPQAKEPQEFPGAGLNPGRILLWSRQKWQNALVHTFNSDSGLQNQERVNFYCFYHQVCGNLLRQPQETNK